MKKSTFIKAVLTLLTSVSVTLASAADIYVSNGAGDDTKDGLSPANAVKTISKAFTISLVGDVIHVMDMISMSNEPTKTGARGDIDIAGLTPAKTYTVNGVTYTTWNVNGTLGIIPHTRSVTIVGDDKATCGFDGNGASCLIRQDLSALGANNGGSGVPGITVITYKNITFKNGKSNDASGGGGFYLRGGFPVVFTAANFENCEFVGNMGNSGTTTSVLKTAGGLFMKHGQLTLKKCRFAENMASKGGAMYLEGGDIMIDSCVIENNDLSLVTGSSAAAILTTVPSAGVIINLDVKNTLFKNNKSATYGGAFACTEINPTTVTSGSSNIRFTNCAFVNNTASTGLGGAAFIQNTNVGTTQAVSFINTTFTSNQAGANSAGAIAVNSLLLNSKFNLINCTVSGNTVAGTTGVAGAGVRISKGASAGVTKILNSIIENNTAVDANVANEVDYADLGIENNIDPFTFVESPSYTAGTSLIIDKSIIGSCKNIDFATQFPTNNVNYVFAKDGSIANSYVAKLGVYDAVKNYFPLLAGSPAVGYGNASYLTSLTPTNSTDQLGNTRKFLDGKCDAGSYEFSTSVPSTPVALLATAGGSQVSVAFTQASNGGLVITNYKYSLDNGLTYTTCSPAQTSSPILISGLTNGNSYTIKLIAINEFGESGASVASNSVTPNDTNIYLSNAGLDTNDGLSSWSPVKTLSKAFTIAKVGDVIHVMNMININEEPQKTGARADIDIAGLTSAKTYTVNGVTYTTWNVNGRLGIIPHTRSVSIVGDDKATCGFDGNGASCLIRQDLSSIGANNGGLGVVGITVITYKNLTFKNGKSDDASGGGGVYLRGGFPTVYTAANFENCEFSNNTGNQGTTLPVLKPGGGLTIIHGTASLKKCSFNNNIASKGGAIYIQAGNTSIDSCVIENHDLSLVSNSNAAAILTTITSAGAILNLDIKNTLFKNNKSATYGGAFVSTETNPTVTSGSSNIKFTNCAFVNNTAGTGLGGAAFINNINFGTTQDISFINTTFTGNQAGVNTAGAIAVNSLLVNSKFNLINCTVSGNKVTGYTGAGGAGVRFLKASAAGVRKIQNCILENNTSIDAAMYPTYDYADLGMEDILDPITFVPTPSYVAGTNLLIEKSIIGSCKNTDFNTQFPTNISNYVYSDFNGDIFNSFVAKLGAFDTLKNYFPLLANSSAINYGNASFLTALTPTINTDQIGTPRLFANGFCSAGAFEFTTKPSTPTSLVATAGNAQISVAFTEGSNGGSVITNYKYSIDGGSTFHLCSPAQIVSPIVISGLTNGTIYFVKIKSVNINGESDSSNFSNGVTPSVSTNLNNAVNSSFTIYRNANNQLVVNNTSTTVGIITVSNMMGQVVATAHMTGAITTINKILKAGAYIVMLQANGATSTQKVILN